ncbi:hypothetical protein EDD37DRAFT_477931 [Exophiala viscosa]|uniref:Scytalone dehydratase-like domain-containing protein n=1 Tax=Exophiala viscosa TaxID=2486360 RepID=A0AAN6IDJ3_9EURO|nr:hypothetical protein EDD36DRAFT_210894 [Exophiala viscosa]KAI1622498.1 hypothetical protein EDD37DRAFT_477931 [Exophiala viscosa]
MESSFALHIPTNLTFQDYFAVTQTARTWADGYDLKSYAHLISTLAPQVSVDYTDVNPDWGKKIYDKEAFAKLWLSEEHLGNSALNTQHLLGLPYFSYVGPKRPRNEFGNWFAARPTSHGEIAANDQDSEEIEVSWQILASHGRRATDSASEDKDHLPLIGETSDHRAFMTQVYFKVQDGDQINSSGRVWRLASIKPSPIYATGVFSRVRRPSGAP